MATWTVTRVLLGILVITSPAMAALADSIAVAGHGEAPLAAVSKKQQPDENRRALAAAEDAAVRDALAQAVFRVYGNRDRLGPAAERILSDVHAHSATIVLEKKVKRAEIVDGKAIVEVAVRADPRALRDYLQDSVGLSLTQETEGRFRIYVLAYTVEGMDPNRAAPPVLREEVTDNKKNVHENKESSSSSSSGQKTNAQASSSAAAASSQGNLQARSQETLRGSASSSGSLDAKGSAAGGGESASFSGSAKAQDSASIDARSDQSVSGRWDERATASQSAANFSHQASAQSRASSKQSFSDASTQYHKLVVYADVTKKGSGTTNEVRAKLGEMLKREGFVTAFADLNLMGRSFANEDEIYTSVLKEMRSRPDIRGEDWIAVALNRLTPIQAQQGARFSAQITYRVLRLSDGHLLLPDKVLASESGDQVSEDLARTVATELAMMKVAEVFPNEVSRGLKALERETKRDTAAAVLQYSIRVENVSNPVQTRGLKDALRKGGFEITGQFRGDAKSEAITVKLSGRSGADVTAVLEPLLGAYDVVTLDDRAAVLRSR